MTRTRRERREGWFEPSGMEVEGFVILSLIDNAQLIDWRGGIGLDTSLIREKWGQPEDVENKQGNGSARGGSRTHMRKNPRRILSPQRLPFRHPGRADKKK
jgi:hypothetical protein